MTEVKNDVQNQEKDEFLKISLVNQGISIKKNRVDPLSSIPDSDIDYKNLELLNKYISERGKILPKRVTGTCAMHQREVTTAIKRARIVALLPYVAD